MSKFKVNDTVKIILATGFADSKNGDIAKVISTPDYTSGCFAVLDKNKEKLHLCDIQAELVPRPLVNRNYLADFLKLNNIKKTLVSKYLGYSQNWLTQMANDKRLDMTDKTLKYILAMLHIDWASQEFINVRETKEHTAYRTKPSTYTTHSHKERLQRAFWNGEFIK